MEEINNSNNTNTSGSVDKKVIIYTGGTDGIGRSGLDFLTKSEGNTKFILPVRNLEKGEKVVKELKLVNPNADFQLMKMDLSSLESIKSFVQEFNETGQNLDTLVCNAGIISTEFKTTVDGYETTFGVNHLGTSLLTMLLLPKLNASTVDGGGNIVIVSSKMHDRINGKFDFDKQFVIKKQSEFSSTPEYSKSKLWNLLFAQQLQSKLTEAGSNVKVNALHPGFAATSLSRDHGAFANKVVLPILVALLGNKLEDMGSGLADLTLNKSNVKGKYFSLTKETTPSKFAQNHENSKTLWNKTMELLSLNNELQL